jgi:hypothetical protein
MASAALLEIAGKGAMSLFPESLTYGLAFFACHKYVHFYAL